MPASYRPRRGVPALYALHRRDLDAASVTVLEGIPIMTPARAIVDGVEEHLPPRLIEQAIENAGERGLLAAKQIAELRGRLDSLAV